MSNTTLNTFQTAAEPRSNKQTTDSDRIELDEDDLEASPFAGWLTVYGIIEVSVR